MAHQVDAGRWKVYGVHGIAVHTMPLDLRARCRVSVWEAGEHAALDGSTSLTWRGLTGWNDGIHVIVPWPGRAVRWDGAVVHPSRLWNAEDLTLHDGLRLTLPDVAAIRAAMWARSDRAAATIMAMSVQQRVATAEQVLLEAKRLNRHKRRPLILDVARDIAEGAQALSELDFARLCRRRDLPRADPAEGSREARTGGSTSTSSGRSGRWSSRWRALTTTLRRTPSTTPSVRTP